LREAIAGYKQFQTLVEQYVHLRVQASRAERTADSKKKTPPPNSSWRRNKRSKN
jgi:hypothetical protein